MTFPQGALDPIDAILFPVDTPTGGGIPAKYNLLQPFVENALKQKYVQDNPSIQNPLASIYEGLPEGTPMPLAILTVLARKLLGSPAAVWDSVTGVLAAIQPWVENVPGLGDVIELLTGVPDGDESDLASWLSRILTTQSPLNAAMLVGTLREAIFGGLNINVAQIGTGQPDLQFASSFDTAASIEDPLGEFVWDGTVGWESLGSAKVVADGNRKVLFGNIIPVEEKQRLTFTVGTKRQSLVWSGSAPLQLGIRKYNASGHTDSIIKTYSPTSNTTADFGSGTKISETWDVPVSSGITKIRQFLVLESSATSGTVWFDDAPVKKTGGWLQTIISQLNQMFDIFNGLTVTPIDETVQGVKDWWGSVGAQFEQGAAQVQNFINDAFGGLSRIFSGGNKSSSDVAFAAFDTTTQAVTGLELGEWNNAILSVRNNKSIMSGVDETSESNFLIDSLLVGGTDPPSMSVTSSSSRWAFWRAEENAKKGAISWFGKGFASITALYIDVYKMNFDTEAIALLHTSDNLIGQVTSDWSYLVYNMDEADRVDVAHGDVLIIAFRVTGAGTHTIAGKLGSWLPAHPTAHPAKPALAVSGGPYHGAAFTDLNPYYTGDTPWIGISIVEGDVPPAYNAPRTTAITETGAYSYTIPAWANEIDVILAGAGGGGRGGDGGFGQKGKGGRKGSWSTETLVRGVDFPSDATTLSGTIGTGGAGGIAANPTSGNGGNGGNTTRSAISSGKAAMTANGGAGGSTYDTADSAGQTLENQEYGDGTYVGGTGGAAGNGGVGGVGGAPGAGGGGGAGGIYGICWSGGAGGAGRAWFVARQS